MNKQEIEQQQKDLENDSKLEYCFETSEYNKEDDYNTYLAKSEFRSDCRRGYIVGKCFCCEEDIRINDDFIVYEGYYYCNENHKNLMYSIFEDD